MFAKSKAELHKACQVTVLQIVTDIALMSHRTAQVNYDWPLDILHVVIQRLPQYRPLAFISIYLLLSLAMPFKDEAFGT